MTGQVERSAKRAWIVLLSVSAISMTAVTIRAQAPQSSPAVQILQIEDEPGSVPNPADEELPAPLRRQPVFYRSNEIAGSIVIHAEEHYLYLIQANNRAVRYSIGVGREAFTLGGKHRIVGRTEWPEWNPSPAQMERNPKLPSRVDGGSGNPWGARVLYLSGTECTIHGTNQPKTIGYTVAAGCFRMVNADVIDLYERVPIGGGVTIRAKVEWKLDHLNEEQLKAYSAHSKPGPLSKHIGGTEQRVVNSPITGDTDWERSEWVSKKLLGNAK